MNGVPQDNFLDGVSCVGTSFCVAVGYINGTSTDKTLIQKWNGTSWATVNSPHPGTGSFLNAVSCVSTSFCLAVGSYGTSTTSPTLVEKWNGSKWTMVTSPNPVTPAANGLDGVSCASTTFCLAVGSSSDNVNPGQTLTTQWNGKGWKAISSPDTSVAQANQLNAVSCTSSSFCAAVGQYDNGSNYPQSLAQKWNGTSWTITKSPNTSSVQDNELSAVSCTSASLCMSGGHHTGSTDNDQLLAQKCREDCGSTVWRITAFEHADMSFRSRSRASAGLFEPGSTASCPSKPRRLSRTESVRIVIYCGGHGRFCG